MYVDETQYPACDAISLAAGTATRPAATISGEAPVQVNNSSSGGTGTLNIFSEFTGTTVFIYEKKMGDDIKTVNSIPAGNHYLKVMKDGVSIFGDKHFPGL